MRRSTHVPKGLRSGDDQLDLEDWLRQERLRLEEERRELEAERKRLSEERKALSRRSPQP